MRRAMNAGLNSPSGVNVLSGLRPARQAGYLLAPIPRAMKYSVITNFVVNRNGGIDIKYFHFLVC
jgi:hypothetical protein